MPANLQKARELFLHAVGKLPPDRWQTYVAAACGEDSELERQVRHLLQVHLDAGSFLERPAVALGARDDCGPAPATEGLIASLECPGTTIGPYKLLEQIGEGGFGVVFMAEQQHPVRRRVALKVLKPGMDTRQVVARFEAERQALALMDHPHIARVLDAGATESGRPYFVMELIRGIPITGFCDENRLTLRERLELFFTVCQAVQHAHQKGIIHRDLKPSNVLVTLHEGAPLVKVIDFGIAKAMGHERLTDKTLFTGFAQMIGTPLYMSPEQAEMSGRDVDTRTDIYGLGVLLYELLTGTTPFDRERLKEASYDEIRRIILEEEPAKPSTRISTLGQAAITVSANRKSEPKRLSQLFRGELDWIVLKALEKDRNRRYDTASAFAADVQCYLDDEPVQACPPTLARRAAKWGRRHKTVVWGAMALLFLTTIGLGVGTFLIMQERDVAQANSHRAEQILDTAYRSLDKMYLAWAEKRLPQVKEATPEDRQFLEDALVFYAEFAKQNSSAPAGRHKTAQAYLRVATIQGQLGQAAEAKRNYHYALEALRRLVAEFPNDADYCCSLARGLSGRMDSFIHEVYFGTTEENEAALREAIQFQERLVAEHPTWTEYQRDLAESYFTLGDRLRDDYGYERLTEVEKLWRAARSIFSRLAEEYPTEIAYRNGLCAALGGLGTVLTDTGRMQEAGKILYESLERRKKFVADFPGLSDPRWSLSFGYQDLAHWQWEARLTPWGPRYTGAVYQNGAQWQYDARMLRDAAESWRQALDVRAKLASDFPRVPMYRNLLAESYAELALVLSQIRRVHEAEQNFRDALAIREVLVRDYPAIVFYTNFVGHAQSHIGRLLSDRGEPEAALAWFDQAIAAFKRVFAKDPRHGRRDGLSATRGYRAVALVRLHRFQEAELAFQQLEQTYREDLARDPANLVNWICDAPLRLQLGDREGYHTVCRDMLVRFSPIDDPSMAALTAQTWLLVPAMAADLGPILRLADRAITGTEQSFDYRWFLLVKGMADYRAGHFDHAVDRLQQALSLGREPQYLNTRPLSGMAQAFLAMAHQRLGRAAQARQALQQARELMEEPYSKIGWNGSAERAWHNWLRFYLVYQEAEALVKGEAQPGK